MKASNNCINGSSSDHHSDGGLENWRAGGSYHCGDNLEAFRSDTFSHRVDIDELRDMTGY